MTEGLPAWLDGEDAPEVDVAVDWAALPDDWREVPYRLTLTSEDRAAHANRVRAAVAEGLAPAAALGFADYLLRQAVEANAQEFEDGDEVAGGW